MEEKKKRLEELEKDVFSYQRAEYDFYGDTSIFQSIANELKIHIDTVVHYMMNQDYLNSTKKLGKDEQRISDYLIEKDKIFYERVKSKISEIEIKAAEASLPFWLETLNERYMYYLLEEYYSLKKEIMYKEIFGLNVNIEKLSINKKNITFNQADPTAGKQIILSYDNPDTPPFKKKEINISEAWGCLIFTIEGNDYNYNMDTKDKNFLTDEEDIDEMNKNIKDYLELPMFDITKFWNVMEFVMDHYHGEVQHSLSFQDPMGCLADYE